MAIDYEIRHFIPGRIRVHVPAIGRVAGFGPAIERLLPTFDGVSAVRINPTCQSVVVEFDPARGDVAETLRSALATLTPEAIVALASTAGAAPARSDAAVEPERDGGTLSIACAAAVLALIPGAAPLAWLGIAWASAPIARRAFTAVFDEERLNVDVLDMLAIGFAALQGSTVTGAILTGLVALGDTIRELTAGESERAIAQLIEFQNTQACVVRDGTVVLVEVARLQKGDTVVVYAGGTIPVDGTVTRGRGSVDQQTVTGESAAVDRSVGDTVYAGTTIVDGELYICAERVGADTAAAQMVSLVEQAPRTDTRIQNYAERYADELVAPSLAAAGSFFAVSGNVNRLTSMLMVDVGTGIRIAAPTSVLATITRAARQGILVKGGRSLEQLSGIDTIVFDKTGTLTTGSPEIVAVHACDAASADEVLAIAAAAELRCPHPVARAVVDAAATRGLAVLDRSESHYRLGLGVEARVCGARVHAGSERFLQRRGVDLQGARRRIEEAHARGLSSLLVARDGRLIGTVDYRDRIRPESGAVVRTLRNRRLRCIMLTGDNQRIASAVARELGLDEVYSGVLPSQKAEIVQELQAQGRSVAMIGDGMNDTAALAYADVGIAMHGGADVARASADVVLIDGSLWNVVTAIDLAERAVGLIQQNWQITAAANALAFVLAIPAATVSPIITALLSNGSAILAGVNAARPLWG